jgi:hypothetical protein
VIGTSSTISIEGMLMKAVSKTLVAVVSLMMLAAPVAVADDWHDGGDHRHRSVIPADKVAGNSGGRLLGDWFVENLSRPADASPFGGTANLCLDLGRRGKVLSPAGGVQDETGLIEMTCTVKVGRPVVMVMTSADCSTAEAPPFFGTTAREQRACAVGFLRSLDIRSINLSVDGRRAVDIHKRRFLEVSRQRHVVFPENAVFGATPGPATFVAAAWMAEIRGMKRGAHTVNGTTTLVFDGQTLVFPFIVHFEVIGRR